VERQTLSIGFADLSNYIRLINAVGAEKAIDVLQEAFTVAGDAILRNGGQIRKYIGDAVLFTCPDPRQAARIAETIASGFRRQVDGVRVRFNVGVATGEVWVGEIGHPAHRAEDVLGEAVNRAALLVRQASQGESGVALDDETRKHV
jgi:adenylate cyclase